MLKQFLLFLKEKGRITALHSSAQYSIPNSTLAARPSQIIGNTAAFRTMSSFNITSPPYCR